MWFATAKRPRARLPRRGTVLGGHAPDSGVVSALSGQHIGLRGHNEVVPVEAADLVGPPGHRDTPPLGEEGRMVTLRLSEGADPVGEGQRLGEVREVEGRSSRAIPSRSSSCQPETSRPSSAISVAVTRGESRRQAIHRSPDSVLIQCTLLPAQLPSRRPSNSIRGLQGSPCARATLTGCGLQGPRRA